MPFPSSSTTSTAAVLDDVDLADPPTDTVLDLAFLPQANFLAASSWDNKVRLYEINPNGLSQGKAMYEHQAPVLSTRWTADGSQVVSGGCDNAVRLYDVASGQSAQIGAHDAPVKAVRVVACGPSKTPVVVSGSWDKTLKYWDMRTPNAVATVPLLERVYAMDLCGDLLVAATASNSPTDKNITVIDLNNPGTKFKETTTPLKCQIKLVTCFIQGNGYAVGLIEGRLAVQYVRDEDQKLAFSFKCHRTSEGAGAMATHTLYTLNCIVCHPVHGTFLTAGLDGVISFWDKDLKHRLKNYQSLWNPITAAAFNRDGTILSYAVGYDWSKGAPFNKSPLYVKLHAVKDEEVMKKKT